jgi:hypothetical protein
VLTESSAEHTALEVTEYEEFGGESEEEKENSPMLRSPKKLATLTIEKHRKADAYKRKRLEEGHRM